MDASGRSGVAGQLEALRRDAAVSSLDERGVLAARGADRASFLQGMLSNEVAKLASGEGNPALLLTEQGRVVAALQVYALDDAIWLDVARSSRRAVAEALERFVVADDVELEELAAAAVAVRGPAAAAALERIAGGEGGGLASLADCAHRELDIAGQRVRAARARDLGADAFHLWTADAPAAERLLGALLQAGLPEAGRDALEALRTSEGRAREGLDFGPQTLASEVPSLASSISYRKGCYLGQEVVERVAARGHVNWLVVGLAAAGEAADVPERDARVLHDGAEVGRVTSATSLPDGAGIAMLARVRRAAAEAGSGLTVEVHGRRLDARVAGGTGRPS